MKHETMLVHILEKVDKIQADVAAVRVDQQEIKSDLRYHIKRTDLLEEMVKGLQKKIGWLAAPVDLIRSVLQWLKLMK